MDKDTQTDTCNHVIMQSCNHAIMQTLDLLVDLLVDYSQTSINSYAPTLQHCNQATRNLSPDRKPMCQNVTISPAPPCNPDGSMPPPHESIPPLIGEGDLQTTLMSVLQHMVPYVHSTSYILQCCLLIYALLLLFVSVSLSTLSTSPHLTPPLAALSHIIQSSLAPSPAWFPRFQPIHLGSQPLHYPRRPSTAARRPHSPTSLTPSPDRVSSSFWLGASYSRAPIDIERIAYSTATVSFGAAPAA